MKSKNRQTSESFKYFFKLYKPYRYSYFVILFLSILVAGCYFLFTQASKLLIDYCIDYNPEAAKSSNIFNFLLNGTFGEPKSKLLLATIILVMLLTVLLKNAARYIKAVFSTKINVKYFEADIRCMAYDKMLKMTQSEINYFSSGEILAIINTDTTETKTLIGQNINNILYHIIMIIFSIVYLYVIDPILCIVPLIGMPIILITLFKQLGKSQKFGKEKRETAKTINNVVSENIAGIRTVKAYAAEETEIQKFDKCNKNYEDVSQKFSLAWNKYWLSAQLIRSSIHVISLFLGTKLIFDGVISTGSYFIFLSYVSSIVSNTNSLTRIIFNSLYQVTSMNKLHHFLTYEEDIKDCDKTTEERDDNPVIEFKNVSLVINNNRIIDDISFTIPYGQKVAIMGATGSGKTVLFMLLNRFLDPTSGEILINGKNIKTLDLNYLRSHFSYVMQNTFLYSNTIYNNISYYDEDTVDEERLYYVSKIAYAHDFIEKLDKKYDTVVGERGYGLSGGQKQRVTIARALYKNAPIFLFDEAFSALDQKTESQLINNLHSNYDARTWIVTSHRANTAKEMDLIIVLDNGSIKEMGDFETLMSAKGIFFNIYSYQESLKKEGDLDEK